MASRCGPASLRRWCLLRKGLQDGIHLLGHSCQRKLKLLLRKRQARRNGKGGKFSSHCGASLEETG